MRTLRVWPIYAILTALAVLPAAGCAFDQGRITEDYHTAIDKAPTTVEVHNAVGAIEIDAWDKPSVQVDARKRGANLDDVHAITVSVQQTGSTLVITSHFPANSTNCRVDYTIHAPATANIDLDQSVGAIKSDGFTANVHESTTTGAIAATMGALGSTQDVNLHVGVGAIALKIPATSSAAFSASTSVGAIGSNFPLNIQRNIVGSSASGSIGKGEAHVDLAITTGAIAVQRE
jgi:hypothetical protein